jgi:hypothetical protein
MSLGKLPELFWALAFLLTGALAATAQTSATGAELTGVVRDQTGGVLPGSTVTATSLETNATRTVTTDPEGRFVIPALPPATYRIRAELQGFSPHVLDEVRLLLGSRVELEFTLAIAGAQEAVMVVGAESAVEARKTAVSHVIARQQIETLPIDRRNFITFTILTPGVTTDRIPQQTHGATPSSGLSFAGQRPRSNNITVDGVDNNDLAVGSVRATFSQDAVREFQVLANSYSAEFGKASGGVVNIVTKSGGNTPAGSAFFYLRDDVLNAKGHFERFDPTGTRIDRPKAPFSQKQGGGTLGGAIRKNRTFYFLSAERLDVAASNFVTIDDRSAVAHPVTGQAVGTPAEILRRAGFPVDTGNVPYVLRSDQVLAKLDQHADNGRHLTMRFNWADLLDENTETFGGLTARSRAGALESTDYGLAASWTAVLSNSSLNELRVQRASRDQLLRALDPTCEGICDREDEGGPTLEVIGIASLGRQRVAPQPRRAVRYQIVDTFSLFRGAHQMKAGLDFSYIDTSTQRLPLHFGGRYIFAPLPAIPGVLPAPISSIQAVVLGLPAAYVQGYGHSAAPYGYKDLSLFVQDDWRITSRATLKAGVRYQKQFWPSIVYDVPGVPNRYRFPGDSNNFAPRVALAWNPDGNRRTSVRAAYGIFYDNHITGIVPITKTLDGKEGVRTLVLRFPQSIAAWNAPGRQLPEAAVGPFPSLQFAIDPALQTPFAHHVTVGIDRELPTGLLLSATGMYVRGYHQLGTIDYNPLVPALGPGRRPEDVNGVPGSSASILQYTSYGETWYRGLAVSVSRRFEGGYQFLASYTLSKAEDNATDFQSAFIPENNGRGRDRDEPSGLPVGFDPEAEKGTSAQDQRHRLVLSGLAQLPAGIQASAIAAVESGRPYTILAGADLNGDGDGGAFPPDRARRTPADPSTSVRRNSGVLPFQGSVGLRVSRRFPLGGRARADALVEIFNLFNRANFTEINGIFGTGAFPDAPLPTFGLFEQAGPPRQVQIGLRVDF